MPELERVVNPTEAIKILQTIRGFFNDDAADPVAQRENEEYLAALDLAIEALKARK